MNSKITEMKTTLEGINRRITEAEKRISDLEDRMVEFTAAEQNKEKRMKRNEDSLRLEKWKIEIEITVDVSRRAPLQSIPNSMFRNLRN